jgi:coenzyme F420-reducing hydrogenase beta subunit
MECTDFDNSIKMERFKSTISLSENAYYALRKKLVDNAVIAEKDKEWYINPIIMMKSDKVLTDVWLLFKDKSKKIY